MVCQRPSLLNIATHKCCRFLVTVDQNSFWNSHIPTSSGRGPEKNISNRLVYLASPNRQWTLLFQFGQSSLFPQGVLQLRILWKLGISVNFMHFLSIRHCLENYNKWDGKNLNILSISVELMHHYQLEIICGDIAISSQALKSVP